jgi:uncharacterized protein (DUF305 family)
MLKIRFTLATTAAIATLIALSACSTAGPMEGMDHGGNSASPSSSARVNTGAHNDADVTFAMGMVPHHQQAVEMADTILGKGGIDDRVTALAKKIKAAQAPEITLMTGWLDTWGSPVDSMSNMPGMDMGTGMMSKDDMSKLAAATGLDASRLFLEQMIVHHTGALDMADIETSSGTNPAAQELAKNIFSGQTAEIAEMKSILASL